MPSLATKIKEFRSDGILVWNIKATNCAFGVGPGASLDVQRQLIHFGAVFLRFAIPFGFLVGGSVACLKARRASKLFTKINANAFATISALSSTEFERLIGEGFRRQGYHVIEGPGRAADGVVDLHITKGGAKYLVQCKHWRSRQVGVKVVRELYGVIAASGAAGGFVVTGGHYFQRCGGICQRTRN